MQPSRPNLLLISADQLRGDCIGCAGHPVVETPYIDQMAAEGVRFTSAYSAVPACTPARAAILTGMDQWNHGRLMMAGTDELEYPATLPGELAKAGYHTQGIGKMHHHPQRKLYGFHNMLLDEDGRRLDPNFISDYHRYLALHRDGPYDYYDHGVDWNSWVARPSHLPEHLHPTYWTAEEGINFLSRRDPTKPFFLWLSFSRPHSPYDPPRVYFDMYKDRPDIPKPYLGDWAGEFDIRIDDVNAPRTRRTDEEIRRARAAYFGSVTFIDHQIGRFLYAFRRLDPAALANTLIIFVSDHGDMLGDHHHWRKTYAFEGSAHVPLILQLPRTWGKPKRKVVDEPVELRDIMPTLLDAAGVPIPDSVDGSSLLPLVRGEPVAWRQWVQGEYTSTYSDKWGMQYVTNGREKYIWYHATNREHVFDLVNDPGECRDLSREPALRERIEYWRSVLAQINEERGDPRGASGRLVPQPTGALRLSPNYYKWKERAAAMRHYGASIN